MLPGLINQLAELKILFGCMHHLALQPRCQSCFGYMVHWHVSLHIALVIFMFALMRAKSVI